MLANNLAELKGLFHKRGLHELARQLDQPLDYEKQEHSLEVYGNLDRYYSVSLSPVLEKDGLGVYQLGDIKVVFSGSDPMNPVNLVIPKDYQLNRAQILNLVQDRPVYLHTNLWDGHEGKWLQLDRGIEPGQFGIYTYQPDHSYDLGKELAKLAEQTGLHRLISPEVLHELQQGNTYRLSGHHPKDQPFVIQADPGSRSMLITDVAGKEFTKESLLESQKHESPDLSKTVQANLPLGKEKDKTIDPSQGQAL